MVFNNQTQYRVLPTILESKQTHKSETLLKCGGFLVNSCNFSEDETASWFQGTSNNSVDKELSDFFYEVPTSELNHADKAVKEDLNACSIQSSFHPQECAAYPPNFSLDDGNTIKFSKPGTTDLGIANSSFGEETSSCRTTRKIPSSICRNMIEEKNCRLRSAQDGLHTNINESMIASSSGGSGFSFVRTSSQITTTHSYKRKERNGGKCGGHSEEAEYGSADESKRTQKPESGCRSRAAEVHNLSERKRRDRINEKLRELQDLIPHSKKIDKVSVLDEAIEYLKSLRLQLQSMWMRSGTAPILYPSIHHHMSCMAIGMNHNSITSTRRSIQLSKAPPSDMSISGTYIQPTVYPPQDPSCNNFATQLQNFHLPAQHSDYLGFPLMQMPQVLNMCTTGQQM